jgi:hypothetical protein
MALSPLSGKTSASVIGGSACTKPRTNTCGQIHPSMASAAQALAKANSDFLITGIDSAKDGSLTGQRHAVSLWCEK